jgi:hypothetical protein
MKFYAVAFCIIQIDARRPRLEILQHLSQIRLSENDEDRKHNSELKRRERNKGKGSRGMVPPEESMNPPRDAGASTGTEFAGPRSEPDERNSPTEVYGCQVHLLYRSRERNRRGNVDSVRTEAWHTLGFDVSRSQRVAGMYYEDLANSEHLCFGSLPLRANAVVNDF